ncbi:MULTISPECIES: GNAT family N-acetyltransferase [Rheinheimera]|uniref:GNAT family N-acetyltransferase n=1 Tax=Rheinheimera marina TaxID=1774958 RepID=A0ABV9JNF1_9GAMM
MQFVHCTFDQHAEAILAIFNHAILHTTALYEYKPRSIETMQNWFVAKQAGNFPVLGLMDEHNKLVAFGSYGTFRAFPAFKYSVEHSVYVAPDQQGKGYGRLVLQRLIEQATAENYHLLIGGIDAANEGSIALHKKLGFVHSGTIAEAGFKFGRWLDLAFYQLKLATPAEPVDG